MSVSWGAGLFSFALKNLSEYSVWALVHVIIGSRVCLL